MSMRVSSPLNYVGEIRGRSDFEIVCSGCKKPVSKDDPSFLYIDKEGRYYIYAGSCSIALDGIGVTRYEAEGKERIL